MDNNSFEEEESQQTPPLQGARPPSIVHSNDNNMHDDEMNESSRARVASLDEESTDAASHLIPPLPERTLKEKLVERERQKRLETERARLMRQFALSNGGEEHAADDGVEVKEDGSIVGTVGEGSSVAAAHLDDMDTNENGSEKLGYVMERFLSEREGAVATGKKKAAPPRRDNDEPGGVVMERFLSEPVVVPPVVVDPTPSSEQAHIDSIAVDQEHLDSDKPPATVRTSSSLIGDQEIPNDPSDEGSVLMSKHGSHQDSEVGATLGSIGSVDPDAIHAMSDSMEVDRHSTNETIEGMDASDLSTSREPDSPSQGLGSSISSLPSTSTDQQPRVLRLTEREIQEMEAIEEASIGNAPPSEREDTLSEVGDIVGPFPDLGNDHLPGGGFSVQTITTASASNTSLGGQQTSESQSHEVEDHHSIDAIETASVSSHLALSPAGSQADVSVTANPPSVTGNEEPTPSRRPSHEVHSANSSVGSLHDPIPPVIPDTVIPDSAIAPMATFDDEEDGPLDAEASAAANANVTNRRLRPGISMTPPRVQSGDANTEIKRVLSMPGNMRINVDEFDYDKHDFSATPRSHVDSLRELPGDELWEPDSTTMSPFRSNRAIPPEIPDAGLPAFGGPGLAQKSENSGYVTSYGALPATNSQVTNLQRYPDHSDRAALIPRNSSDNKMGGMKTSSRLDRVFQSIATKSPVSRQQDVKDADDYMARNIMRRTFPDRFLTLVVALVVELPVLLMISGGSDQLCDLIGKKRLYLLLGLLPVSCAISGNCGLQASNLTIRAISYQQVTSDTFIGWVLSEIGVASLLGLQVGAVLGLYAYVASEQDVSFGLAMFIAQFTSILLSGISGTIIPIVAKSVSLGETNEWIGQQIETVVQDLVGTFAMVFLSYYLLLIFGPYETVESDGGASSQ